MSLEINGFDPDDMTSWEVGDWENYLKLEGLSDVHEDVGNSAVSTKKHIRGILNK